MTKIRGKIDGAGGRKDLYDIGARIPPQKQVVRDIEAGKHLGFHVYTRDGGQFARDNPDPSKKYNVNL